MSTLQSVDDVQREPKFFTSEKSETATDVTHMKENLDMPQELTEHIPEKSVPYFIPDSFCSQYIVID